MEDEEKTREQLLKELAACRLLAEERKHLIHELRQALSEAVKASGLLPVCSRCKKVRDDKEYWDRINAYIREKAAEETTLKLCPECLKKLSEGKEKK